MTEKLSEKIERTLKNEVLFEYPRKLKGEFYPIGFDGLRGIQKEVEALEAENTKLKEKIEYLEMLVAER